MTGERLTGWIGIAGIVGLTLFAIRKGVITDISDILVLPAVVAAGLLAGYGLWLHQEVLPSLRTGGIPEGGREPPPGGGLKGGEGPLRETRG